MPLAVVLLTATAVCADVIDRVLAVVEGRLITLSDVRAVAELGLLDQSAPAVPSEDGADPVLERMIDRVLVLQEVERYAPAPPDDRTIDTALDRLVKGNGSATALQERLETIGMGKAWLRQWVTDNLRIQAYVDQRFGTAVQPSDEELEAYFREHQAQFGGQDLTSPAVQAAARAEIVATRRKAVLVEWVTGLRRRAEIVRPAPRRD